MCHSMCVSPASFMVSFIRLFDARKPQIKLKGKPQTMLFTELYCGLIFHLPFPGDGVANISCELNAAERNPRSVAPSVLSVLKETDHEMLTICCSKAHGQPIAYFGSVQDLNLMCKFKAQ